MRDMREWMLLVLLAVLLVGISSWQGRWSLPTLSSQKVAENTEAEVAQPTQEGLPSLERQLWMLRWALHEADQVFIGKFLGGTGCSMTDSIFKVPAHGSFIVMKVLKGTLKAGDLVIGSMFGCLPSPYSPYFETIPPMQMVIGQWEGSGPVEEALGSVSVPFSTDQNQIHYIWITELVIYPQSIEQRVEQIVLQMLTCREAHQVFWVGQPPGTARVVVDPEQPPEGTSISFSLCITEENFDPEFGEVEMWHYVGYNFDFQVKEGGWLRGVFVRNLFGVPVSNVVTDTDDKDLWYFEVPLHRPGSRHSFSLQLPWGQYEPFLSDQDVYVFSQKYPDLYISPWREEGKPLDILRGALWIPKPKGQ